MDPHPRLGPRPGGRPGKTLVQFVLLLPVLLGMCGLVIDGGLLMASQRQVQNAADAAALAAAMELYRGNSNTGSITSTANSFLSDNGVAVTLTYNGGASNALNVPPQDPASTGSPYKGNSHYAEVLVTKSVPTLFIQVLTGSSSNQVSARAVAGYEVVSSGEGAILLDPTAAPGLSVTNNNARLVVNGAVNVNSQGAGVDQYGATVSSSYAQPAVTTSSQPPVAPIVATALEVAGGVDSVDNIRSYDPAFAPNDYDPSNTDRPVFARSPQVPDPLANLATPNSGNGVVTTNFGSPSVTNNGASGIASPNTYDASSGVATLNPGIYSSISITGGTVILNPGIYVLGPGFKGGGSTLTINGGTVTGNGVMFYNTGSTYATDGTPDSSDGSASPPKSVSGNFGNVNINGGTVNLSPLNDPSSPFNGLLFYQRRWNTSTLSVGGNSNNINLSGTAYAKWALFQLAGQGKYNAQFIVGSMAVTGNATVTINATGKNLGKANQVFLVE